MKPKPMVLTKENVIANMEDRKTMTRRIINPQPPCSLSQIEDTGIWTYTCSRPEEEWKPRYQVGDEVYVAEGYRILGWDVRDGNKYLDGEYLADKMRFHKIVTQREFDLWIARQFPYRPTSGRFMYKSLARTFMTITEVRVERESGQWYFIYTWIRSK